MRRHLIYGVYGSKDSFAPSVGVDENVTRVDLTNKRLQYRFGINKALSDLAKLDIIPSELGIDLLIVATHVQIADKCISRHDESQDSWTREIRLLVPVHEPSRWKNACAVLEKMLSFLTGDIWSIDFRQKPEDTVVLSGEKLKLHEPEFDMVSLFSGGLDSYIGATDFISKGHKPLLISHAGDSLTSSAQKKCITSLRREYPKAKFDRLGLWMDVSNVKIGNGVGEDTTRGRSFLFFAAGIFAGSGLNRKFTLKIPENGLIALNVPLDKLRLGSHSTHTTHPYYVARWNELLQIIGIDADIENPYGTITKGEMIAKSSNIRFLERTLHDTISCSSPSKSRWRGGNAKHCGYCLPCLIRRAAVYRGIGSGRDKTVYWPIDDLQASPLDTKKKEGIQIRSVQYALATINRRPQASSIKIHIPGSLKDLSDEEKDLLADVYVRGLCEVGAILEGTVTKPKSSGV